VRALAADNVIVTGFVDDIREYIGKAAVVVMPLRVGSGTKHRVFQSLAMKKALVTTTTGAEGIALKHGRTAMIADRDDEFVDSVVQVLENDKLRKKLGDDGLRLILEHHDWRGIYPMLDAAFKNAAAKAS
jgi:glycosyltransferase involved in cell wall biosynthesis